MQWSKRQTWAYVQAQQHTGFVTLGERLIKLSGKGQGEEVRNGMEEGKRERHGR